MIGDNQSCTNFFEKKKIKRDNFPNRLLIQYTFPDLVQLFNEAFHDHFVLYQNLGGKNLSKVFENEVQA